MPKWKPGQSGNPKGRPKGAREKRLKWMLSHERALQERVVNDALNGNQRAMQIIADRLWPRLRTQAAPVAIDAQADDIAEAGRRAIDAALAGDVTPDVLRELLGALYLQGQISELTELEERLRKLEESRHQPAPWESDAGKSEGDEKLPRRGKKKRRRKKRNAKGSGKKTR